VKAGRSKLIPAGRLIQDKSSSSPMALVPRVRKCWRLPIGLWPRSCLRLNASRPMIHSGTVNATKQLIKNPAVTVFPTPNRRLSAKTLNTWKLPTFAGALGMAVPNRITSKTLHRPRVAIQCRRPPS